jgi:CubicO group peptidase (beta-lactamase class C family)
MRSRLTIILTIFLLTSGCWRGQVSQTQAPLSAIDSGNKALPSAAYWPTDGWRTSSPEEQGMDGEKLAQMLESVKEQGLNLHSLLVIRHGYLVSETYFQNYDAERKHELYSITKSFVATLVGIAIDQGVISGVNQKVTGFFPDKTFENNDDHKAAMRLEDVLTMTTGLDWEEGDLAYGELYRSRDWVKHMLDKRMSEAPGSHFNYCSGCSHLLSAIVQKQTGMSTQEFAEKYLFKPLGIERYSWSSDAEGIAIGGWGLQMAPRDMAKLGYLYLHGGNWDGQQIVSSAWIEEATRQHVETEDEGYGYGYQWWTYSPLGAYAAIGMGGQTVIVAPDLDLIVVTTAQMDGSEAIFRLVEEVIAPSVQSLLEIQT